MAEVKISDFTMLEKPPYKLPSVKPMIELIVKGSVIEQEKTFGPVFRELYIKYALQYANLKYGETPKEDIKTMDQLIEYLLPIADKHPDTFNAAVYAGLRTTHDLEGKAGVGTRIGSISFSKNLGEKLSAKERNVDIDQLLANFQKNFIQLGLAHYELGYRKNSDESIDVIFPNCYVKDACRMAYDEGALGRVIGGLQCMSFSGICQFLKLLSGFDWDYELLEFDKPHCLVRGFMI